MVETKFGERQPRETPFEHAFRKAMEIHGKDAELIRTHEAVHQMRIMDSDGLSDVQFEFAYSNKPISLHLIEFFEEAPQPEITHYFARTDQNFDLLTGDPVKSESLAWLFYLDEEGNVRKGVDIRQDTRVFPPEDLLATLDTNRSPESLVRAQELQKILEMFARIHAESRGGEIVQKESEFLSDGEPSGEMVAQFVTKQYQRNRKSKCESTNDTVY